MDTFKYTLQGCTKSTAESLKSSAAVDQCIVVSCKLTESKSKRESLSYL